MKDESYLHVYAQYTYHAEARIIGDRTGLTALANAIATALQHGEAESVPVFVNDGEGFTVKVKCVTEAGVEELNAPYYGTFISEEIANWRERAFTAEHEVSRLRKELRAKEAASIGQPLSEGDGK